MFRYGNIGVASRNDEMVEKIKQIKEPANSLRNGSTISWIEIKPKVDHMERAHWQEIVRYGILP